MFKPAHVAKNVSQLLNLSLYISVPATISPSLQFIDTADEAARLLRYFSSDDHLPVMGEGERLSVK
jgi:hypothetical protein